MSSDVNEVIQEVDFFQRPKDEQADFLSMTWCNGCELMDLGMIDPQEYQSESRHWIEGKCQVCSAVVITEIQEEDE
ncbi:hypothetical protein [Marinomonas sp. 2405UD68-3]|uniref:hypothetical protein n=1 Tax=Marinomonas sp. 2405UD68-3 TaxID=3391835 RepID=UPI0039C95F7B